MSPIPIDKINIIKKQVTIDMAFKHFDSGIEFKDKEEQNVSCPFHDDNNPSCSVNTRNNLFHCKSCGKKGDVISFVEDMNNEGTARAIEYLWDGLVPDYLKSEAVTNSALLTATPTIISKTETPTPVPKAEQEILNDRGKHVFRQQSQNNPVFLALLRAYSPVFEGNKDRINQFLIGYDPTSCKLSIPYLHKGNIVRIKLVDKRLTTDKRFCVLTYPTKSHAEYESFKSAPEKTLYNQDVLYNNENTDILLCEGEKDVITATVNGFNAVSGYGGVSHWDASWNELFTGKNVYIVFDNDSAGKDNAIKVACQLFNYKSTLNVKIIPLSDTCIEKGEDLTDYFCKYQKKSSDLNALISNASWHGHLGDEINRARTDKKTVLSSGETKEVPIPSFEKKQNISKAILNCFLGRGHLYSPGIVNYYFDGGASRLIPFNKDDGHFKNLLKQFNLNPTESEYRYVEENLITYQGKKSEIHRFSYYDQDKNTVYISASDNELFKITTDGVVKCNNGTDSILFLPNNHLQSFNFTDKELEKTDLDLLINCIIDCNFSNDGGLDRQQLQITLLSWMMSLFFESIMPHKPILMFYGDKGSGKSTGQKKIGMFLFGETFDVIPMNMKDFNTIISNNALVAFDNVDSTHKGLNDNLAICATGQKIKMRQLYTTNNMVEFSPKCFIAINARTPKFRRDDVSERLIIIALNKIENNKKSQGDIKRLLSDNNDQLLSTLLLLIQRILIYLESNDAKRIKKDTAFRLSDFANFMLKIAHPILSIDPSNTDSTKNQDRIRLILKSISKQQKTFSTEGHVLKLILDEWITETGFNGRECGRSGVPFKSTELVKEFRRISKLRGEECKFNAYNNPVSLGKELTNIKGNLEIYYEVESIRKNTGTYWTFTKKPEQLEGI
jgi:hypothetical protein